MVLPSHQELLRVNALRRAGGKTLELERRETTLHRRCSCDHWLAVYGTLGPGRENHAVLADIGGSWRDGFFVEGVFSPHGWGTTSGFPAFKWISANTPVAEPERSGRAKLPVVRLSVWVLHATDLPRHWARLDEFEGEEYRRVLVPVVNAAGETVLIANLYEAAG